MILTNCAACAAPLPRLAKQCSRCQTRYCHATCQQDHWRRGHKQICKRIHRGGNAEQYHADKKYKEAVAVAVEACAEDTKGQTCYICTEAVHPRTGEGLVRGCACGDRDGVASGTTGIAHVSCLAEQAKILVAEAEENNLGYEVSMERFRRWQNCSLCKQDYHTVVACALGWACWKTYVGRHEAAILRDSALRCLGDGLCRMMDDDSIEESLHVHKARCETLKRFKGHRELILDSQAAIAECCGKLGRLQEQLSIERSVYSDELKLSGPSAAGTHNAAFNLANTLCQLNKFADCKEIVRDVIPVAQGVFLLKVRWLYANAIVRDTKSSTDDLREAVATLTSVEASWRRIFGPSHPETTIVEGALEDAQEALAAREAPPGGA